MRSNIKRPFFSIALLLLSFFLASSAKEKASQISFEVHPFEGIIKTRVSVAGIDMARIIEKIDYQKGNVQEQLAAQYKLLPASSMSKLEDMMKKNPMLGLVLAMTPPQATIYVKEKIAMVKSKGLGYELQHYHNEELDQAFLYTRSLLNTEAVTASYQPSKGYEQLFSQDKRPSLNNFTISRSTQTAQVAGLNCDIATYTAKTGLKQPGTVSKLIVYTSKLMPKGINFSHPYYLPEANGIMRIDIYLDDSQTPTMCYEVTSIQKTTVAADMLQPKKSTPIYQLTDREYSLKLLAVMMGGMATLGQNDDDDDQ